MKRFFMSQSGSIGSLEGLMLALFAVALIVGIGFAVFPSKPAPAKQPASVTRPDHWPELPTYEPIHTVNPIRE